MYARVRFLLPIAQGIAGAARIRHSLLPLMGDPRRRLGQAVPRDRGSVFRALRGARLVNPGLGRPLSFPLKAVSIRNNY